MSVLSVSLCQSHEFSKKTVSSIKLVKGLGVEGDCHFGATVQHRSRLHIKPPPPNLRQVHLIQYEILQQFGVKPTEIGENITTYGVDLLALGKGTKLHFLPATSTGDFQSAGSHPVISVTGLRNPCHQIEKFKPGLQEKFIVRDGDRKIIGRKAGIMSIVEMGGNVDKGMKIVIERPATFVALECV